MTATRTGRLTVFALLLAGGCGGGSSGSTDGGAPGADGATGVDARAGDGDGGGGGTPDGGSTPGGHSSYVPPGLRPTAAARLIVMGDSISRGAGASRTGLRYANLLASNDDARWASETATDLASFVGGDVDLVSVAVGGTTTDALAGPQLASLRAELGATVTGHSIVVLTSGGNDITGALRDGDDPGGATLDDAIADLRTMVAFFRDEARFPDGVSIYVAAVYDPTDGTGSADDCFFGLTLPTLPGVIDDWRTAYRALAVELEFAMVDALGHFQGHGFHFDEPANPYYDAADPTGWFDDCVHPNDVGHDQFRRLFFEAINPAYSVP